MVIIYENADKTISIVIPTQEALEFATIEQIAIKDVPHNTPYWIIPKGELPSREYRSAWELPINIREPDGFGGEGNEFDAELLAAWGAK